MFTKVFVNLWRQVTAPHQTTYDGYIPYFDGHDDFPLKWAKSIYDSPSAASCLSTLTDFMEGFGFNDTYLENKIVNDKGETFFQIHQKTVKEFATNEGFYWLIRYNALGRKTEIEVLPFENCRLGKPDDNGFISKIFYCPFFGTKHYKKGKNTKEYDTYNPKNVIAQIKEQKSKFKGQVLFVGTTNAISRFYPVHEAYSAHKWNGIEPGISDYHEDNINNGLLQPYILVMRGDPNQPSTNPEYTSQDSDHPITVGEEFDDVMGKNFMGAKRVGNVMVQWVNSEEERPEVVPLPTNANGDLFITLDNQATKKITVAWRVPGILANIQEGVSLGGDANTVRVAVKLMQQRVIKKQRVLTDTYSNILKDFVEPYVNPITIVPYNPYPELEVIDDKIWNEMTTEERRTWIQDNTDIDLNETDLVDNPNQPAPNSKMLSAIPVGFPDKVRANVKKALDYIDKMGIRCGGKSGRKVSEDIIANQNMGVRQLKRIHSFLGQREKYANSPYSDGCEVILYHAWGGKDMHTFLDSKLQDVEKWLN